MSTRWLITFRAIDPRSVEETWEVGVPQRLYRILQNHGHEKAVARLLLVREVLESQGGTHQIHEGWSRPDKEDCFVYLGSPSRDFKSLSIETPPPKGMVFLVFVLNDGTIDEWTWRKVAEEKDGQIFPEGVEGVMVWSMNQN